MISYRRTNPIRTRPYNLMSSPAGLEEFAKVLHYGVDPKIERNGSD